MKPVRPLLPLILAVAALLLLFTVEPALAQAEGAAKSPAVKPQLFTAYFYTRFFIDVVAVSILVVLVYLPIHRKKEFFFTFLILNFLVFIIMFLINKTNAFGSFGAGLGLLAFFSLLRLRTDTISMKDMTYLFVVLTLGLINATMTGPYHELITLNIAIIAVTFGLDKEWLSKSIHTREMQLNSLENVMPQQMDKLVADLSAKTGLEIQRVSIVSVDLVKNRAVVRVYYY